MKNVRCELRDYMMHEIPERTDLAFSEMCYDINANVKLPIEGMIISYSREIFYQTLEEINED